MSDLTIPQQLARMDAGAPARLRRQPRLLPGRAVARTAVAIAASAASSSTTRRR